MLMVVGDVTPDEVKKLAQDKFGSVPSRMLAPRMDIPPPPRLAEARLQFAIPGTKLPQLLRFYRAPSYGKGPKGTPEAMDLLAAIMGGGPTSRLYKTLVVDRKLASEASAFYDGTVRGPGEFGIIATPRDGVSFDTLENAVDQIVRSMTTAAPEMGELERAKTRLVADYTYQHDNQFVLGQDYGTSLSIGLSIADVEDWPNRIKAVQAADVRKAAQTYLLKEE